MTNLTIDEYKHPSVCVITAFFNKKGVVTRTLNSLMRQTYRDTEVIIFDDCSTDGTSDEIDDFVNTYSPQNFKVIHSDINIGFVNALIKIINETDSDYVAIQGAGDISHHDRIKAQVEAFNNDPSIGVVGCFYNNVIESEGTYRPRTPISDNYTITDLLEGNIFTHGEVMFRRDIYEKSQGYRKQFRYAQDYDLWLRMIQLSRFFTVKQFLYDRFVDFDGITYNPKKIPIQARYSLFAKKLALEPIDKWQSSLPYLTDEFLFEEIPSNSHKLQRVFFKSALTMLAWGNYKGASNIASDLISSKFRKFFVFSLCAFFKALPDILLSKVISKATGTKKILSDPK